MQHEPVIVFVEGGCVTDVQGVAAYDVFDWDNFGDDPVTYIDDYCNGLESEFLQLIADASPEVFADIKARYQLELAEREKERRKDPFCDVPAIQG